jgi:hypothetical protein
MNLLSELPPEAWAGLIGVGVGSLLSIFGVWLSSKASLKQLELQLSHEEALRERNLNRSRFEELHTRVGAWVNAILVRVTVKSGVSALTHQAATFLLISRSSIPSMNFTPAMTSASCRNPRSLRQRFCALMAS